MRARDLQEEEGERHMQIFSLMVENLGRDRDKLNGKERETHKNIDIEIERHSKIVRKKKT